MSTVCKRDFGCCFFFFDPRTPQVFALMRITHNNDSMKVSCIFQSRAPSPNNAKSIEALAPTKVRGVDYGEKRAHRGRIDLSPGKLKCISTQFTNDYLLYNYLLFFLFFVPLCNFFLEYDPRFSVAPFQLCPERFPRKENDQSTFTFLTKRIAAVLRFRTTRVRVPLARNPSPLQYRTLRVQTKLCSIFATPTKICTRGWSI